MSAEHGVNLVELGVKNAAEILLGDSLGPEQFSLWAETWVSPIASIVSAVLVLGFIWLIGRKGLERLSQSEQPLVPDDKASWRNLWEYLVLLVVKLGDNAMGKHNRKYLPFIACIFLYIFFQNLLGLVPGFSMSTSRVTFNLGIALVVFVLYNAWGIRECGIRVYLKHLWGPVWWVGPLLFVVELISHCVRPLSLSLRLYGNMTGDHLVLAIFTDMTKFLIPVLFCFLGTFVCFMQAFVFTLLTMIYIRLAVAHEHGEDDEHE